MIYLDTALARKLQERVLDEGSDISTVIGDALESHLSGKEKKSTTPP